MFRMRSYFLKISIVVVSLLGFMSLSPVTVLADCDATTTAGAIACGSDESAGVPSSSNPTDSLDSTISDILNVLSVAIGIIAVVMLMIGGFRYITSGGVAERVATAKKTILYAMVGIAVVALSQTIAKFVLDKTSSTSNTPTTSTGTNTAGHEPN